MCNIFYELRTKNFIFFYFIKNINIYEVYTYIRSIYIRSIYIIYLYIKTKKYARKKKKSRPPCVHTCVRSILNIIYKIIYHLQFTTTTTTTINIVNNW